MQVSKYAPFGLGGVYLFKCLQEICSGTEVSILAASLGK